MVSTPSLGEAEQAHEIDMPQMKVGNFLLKLGLVRALPLWLKSGLCLVLIYSQLGFRNKHRVVPDWAHEASFLARWTKLNTKGDTRGKAASFLSLYSLP